MVAILFIISFSIFIAASYFVDRRSETARHIAKGGGRNFVRSLELPKGIFLSAGHVWAEVLSGGLARVGLDEFVRKLVGPVDRVEILPTDSTVKRSEALCTIYQANKRLTMRSPMSGTIVMLNPQITAATPPLDADLITGGWLAVIQPSDLATDIKFLKIAEEAKSWLRQELRRFREFIEDYVRPPGGSAELAPIGTTLLDGGAPAVGLLRSVGADTWKEFEARFLCPPGNTHHVQ